MGYSFLDLAKEVLEHENIPLSVEEMWEAQKLLLFYYKCQKSSGQHRNWASLRASDLVQ